MIAIKKVVVATDFGPASETALTYGRDIARAFHASLDLLHVSPPVPLISSTGYEYASIPISMQQDIERASVEATERLLTDEDRSELQAKAITIIDDTPAAAIIKYARDSNADLVLVGTHGRGALAHLLLGSVAERVVRLAPCPVLAVHHPEHEFVHPDALVAVATTQTSSR